MTAREMFEELGFRKNQSVCYDDINIKYEKESANVCDILTVHFYNGMFVYTDNMNRALMMDGKMLKAIYRQMMELGWLEEEKKTETNFQHYFECLSKRKMSDFALIDGRFTKCSVTQCSECDFNGDCIEGKFRWLKQPYKKPTYKLTKFEYDLLNAHKDSGMQKCLSNYRPLLELNEKGYFKDIDTSTPIHEILDNCKVV